MESLEERGNSAPSPRHFGLPWAAAEKAMLPASASGKPRGPAP
jgi:hypothetical protein